MKRILFLLAALAACAASAGPFDPAAAAYADEARDCGYLGSNNRC